VRLANGLPHLLIGRSIQAAGACGTAVLSRAIACDMFSGMALARAMALIMMAMAAASGFSPLLGGALDHAFGWRSEFVLVAGLASLVPSAMASCSARPTLRRALPLTRLPSPRLRCAVL
jgi:MFS transporter, DHA1 family, multidrug resistance protein